MTDTWWIDYSAKRLSAATIKATAVGPQGEHPTGVIRYLDAPAQLQTKHTNVQEYTDLVRSGLAMQAMYFEVGRNDPLSGYAGGQANARRALAGASWLGFDGVILFCCDRWMYAAPGNPAIPPSVWQAYLDGAVSVLGRNRTGAYGFADAIDAAVGHVDFFVQCGARSAVRPFVHGWQDNNTQPVVDGIKTDRVLIFKPFTTTPEDDMALTDKQIGDWNNAIISDHVGIWYGGGDSPLGGVGLLQYVKDLRAQVDAIKAAQATGGVDLDALAAKVAALVGPTLAAAVADELKNRLAS
ncbi:glycoside hydrolase domain-containing protein [Amycolatopsis sp. H20-H5]|uniref:glycoside hydrolase domain-containing protein n=1 Tax=Amycolatopsis sp. H20-H5 TaxID=3046309 RepID=UPI002DBFC09E|nr:glycoside hydrolase domain-containing protein [Amycolatopsis sp. H20-H5]MEC3974727.1 glycoside hydrolase domain-containing protein [Amycolatopsis sp. H20-H5]